MARILIVDDEPAIRMAVAGALRRHGYESIEAENVSAALELARTRLPDLIISDVCMEGDDGFSLLKEIRGDERTKTIPFIIITGHPNWDGMVEGIENAADGYIPKPISLDTLLKTVERRLEREMLLRRKAEQIKSQLYQVLEASPDLIGLIDPESWQLFFLNKAGKVLLETGEDYLVQAGIFMVSGMGEFLQNSALPAIKRTGSWVSETVLISRAGRRIPVKLILQGHRRNDNGLDYLSLIAHDLTDRHENERALRASEHRFRCLVDALPDGVLIHDREGRITFSNARAAEMLGYSAGELLRLNFRTLFGGSPPTPEYLECRGVSMRASAQMNEYSAIAKTGETIPVSFFTEILAMDDGVLHLCILHDLTARKTIEKERQSMEVQLRQAQKLESIGQLAAGIAHEINTPTQYIGDNTRFLENAFASLVELIPIYQKVVNAAEREPLDREFAGQIREAEKRLDLEYLLEEVPLAIKQSLEGIERVTKIVRAMKDFSHPDVSEKTLADINHSIESTLTVARNEWKYVATVEMNRDGDLPMVPCLPGELNQVFLNVIVNAAHAIADAMNKGDGEKGVISISTRRSGDWAEIRIGDTGSGIPEAAQSRIFEPFFTTKDVGKGTGQGLAIARSVIVEKHGGTIHFETELGKGTTFIIRLPLIDHAAEGGKA